MPIYLAHELVRNIGFEPIQSETTDLQSGPALLLRRLRMFKRIHLDRIRTYWGHDSLYSTLIATQQQVYSFKRTLNEYV